MHHKLTLLLLIMLILSLAATTTNAWNKLAHEVITYIAYQELKPDVKRKVDYLVASFNQDYPSIHSIEILSTWPDAIRSQKIDTYTRWHYIDRPLVEDGVTAPQTDIASDNALWALSKIKPIVSNEQANPFERARFLAFLIHIVEDLHQPLHTASLFSKKHPKGDRGGNAYLVRYHHKTISLHALWDKGVGTFEGKTNSSNIETIAHTLTQAYPKTYFAEQAMNLHEEQWLAEGMKNAKEYVYTTKEEETVSEQYIHDGQKLAAKEATLAGYRLGNLLNKLLG